MMWFGFAVSFLFVVASVGAAVVFVVDVWEEAEAEELLDELWADEPWVGVLRDEIRGLPEVVG